MRCSPPSMVGAHGGGCRGGGRREREGAQPRAAGERRVRETKSEIKKVKPEGFSPKFARTRVPEASHTNKVQKL